MYSKDIPVDPCQKLHGGHQLNINKRGRIQLVQPCVRINFIYNHCGCLRKPHLCFCSTVLTATEVHKT